MRFRSFLLAGVCLLSPLTVQARQAPSEPATCTTSDVGLPPELAGWTTPTPLAAASGVADRSTAVLTPGQAYRATLPPTPSVTYGVPPEKPGDPSSHGGLFELNIVTPGTYVVALGAGAWVDMLRDGALVTSSAHSHGPACSTLRKMVAFELQAGRYGVQIAGAAQPTLTIMVARRP